MLPYNAAADDDVVDVVDDVAMRAGLCPHVCDLHADHCVQLYVSHNLQCAIKLLRRSLVLFASWPLFLQE
jgi:hypothetical protein